jgi:hypothetical protein
MTNCGGASARDYTFSLVGIRNGFRMRWVVDGLGWVGGEPFGGEEDEVGKVGGLSMTCGSRRFGRG